MVIVFRKLFMLGIGAFIHSLAHAGGGNGVIFSGGNGGGIGTQLIEGYLNKNSEPQSLNGAEGNHFSKQQILERGGGVGRSERK